MVCAELTLPAYWALYAARGRMDEKNRGSNGERQSASERMSDARDAAVDRAVAARKEMGERASAARDAMGERATAARDAMGERATAAREAAAETAGAAREAAADAIAAVKPKLRGVSHEWAFFVSLLLGAGLVLAADSPKATLAVAIYAVSLSALLGTSALYHRVNWKRPNVRAWMRRLDHSMIFFLIAGTYTPFALLVLHGPIANAILAVVWIGAIAGTIVEMIWIDHPKWVGALIYLSLGWVAVVAFPELWGAMGVAGTLLVAAGGLLYTAGAIVYAVQRPNPNPAVFGYHEVFHLFVIAAAAAHFAAVAFYALPKG
jgi:hemolysin III